MTSTYQLNSSLLFHTKEIFHLVFQFMNIVTYDYINRPEYFVKKSSGMRWKDVIAKKRKRTYYSKYTC